MGLLGEGCVGEVVGGVVVHLVDLIDLAETIPCSEVLRIDVDRSPIALYGSVGVLHLKVLMTHQSPSRQEGIVKLDCTFEIDYRLVVVSSQGVIISNYATGLWPILIVVENAVSKIGQLSIVLLDVEDV